MHEQLQPTEKHLPPAAQPTGQHCVGGEEQSCKHLNDLPGGFQSHPGWPG